MQMVGVEGPIRYEDVYPRPTSLSPPHFVDVWVPPPPFGTSFGAPVHPSSSSSPSSSPRTPTKRQALSTLSTIAFNSSPRSISRTVAILATDTTLVEDADTFDIEWCVRLVAFLLWTCPPPYHPFLSHPLHYFASFHFRLIAEKELYNEAALRKVAFDQHVADERATFGGTDSQWGDRLLGLLSGAEADAVRLERQVAADRAARDARQVPPQQRRHLALARMAVPDGEAVGRPTTNGRCRTERTVRLLEGTIYVENGTFPQAARAAVPDAQQPQPAAAAAPAAAATNEVAAAPPAPADAPTPVTAASTLVGTTPSTFPAEAPADSPLPIAPTPSLPPPPPPPSVPPPVVPTAEELAALRAQQQRQWLRTIAHELWMTIPPMPLGGKLAWGPVMWKVGYALSLPPLLLNCTRRILPRPHFPLRRTRFGPGSVHIHRNFTSGRSARCLR